MFFQFFISSKTVKELVFVSILVNGAVVCWNLPNLTTQLTWFVLKTQSQLVCLLLSGSQFAIYNLQVVRAARSMLAPSATS